MYIVVYIYIYIYTYMCIYVYVNVISTCNNAEHTTIHIHVARRVFLMTARKEKHNKTLNYTISMTKNLAAGKDGQPNIIVCQLMLYCIMICCVILYYITLDCVVLYVMTTLYSRTRSWQTSVQS